LCTNHIKSADIEKRDTSVSTIVAIVENHVFQTIFSIDSLATHRSVLFTPYSQRKELCGKKQLQHLHDDGKLHNHVAINGIIWHLRNVEKRCPDLRNFHGFMSDQRHIELETDLCQIDRH
jgi:hypothetical protein